MVDLNSALCQKKELAQSWQWVQLNVGLVRQEGQALPAARKLFESIAALLTDWQATGTLAGFFFMRKPPDVRVRFLTSMPPRTVMTELSPRMQRLQQQGWIEPFFFSTYQPETDRFGGALAMDWVHHYFYEDSLLWLERDRLLQTCGSNMSPERLLPIVFHDLFHQAFNDDCKVLQSWYLLRALIADGVKPTRLTATLDCPIDILQSLATNVTLYPAEIAIIDRYAHANALLVNHLQTLAADHRLSQILEYVLATVAFFTLNRHGFPGERSAPLVNAVIQQLERNSIALSSLLMDW